MRRSSLAITLASTLAVQSALAQPAAEPKADALFDTIRAQDAKLFGAYNSCDLKTLGDMVSEDLEFYHDQTGLARGRQAFVDAIRSNICGKTHRELVPGTMEVYPLKGYGAVEIGDHVFCPAATPSACNAQTSGMAKFTMLWQQTDAGWKLTRVISYDHVSGSARK
ncbi:MAG TPA: nuclear transport factor 2 family protein [Rhizomicrobium sp.]